MVSRFITYPVILEKMESLHFICIIFFFILLLIDYSLPAASTYPFILSTRVGGHPDTPLQLLPANPFLQISRRQTPNPNHCQTGVSLIPPPIGATPPCSGFFPEGWGVTDQTPRFSTIIPSMQVPLAGIYRIHAEHEQAEIYPDSNLILEEQTYTPYGHVTLVNQTYTHVIVNNSGEAE